MFDRSPSGSGSWTRRPQPWTAGRLAAALSVVVAMGSTLVGVHPAEAVSFSWFDRALAAFGDGPPVAAPYRRATYIPPSGRPISDHFDEGLGPYAAGNRGLKYATVPGDPITAIGDGIVVFAGSVAGANWVTVQHPDGLRSSYGQLATVDVRTGQRMTQGRLVGTAGGAFHLGVREGERYIDPERLFAAWEHAHLVPGS